jgi:katanin p60 ATPase-containing subunit A1
MQLAEGIDWQTLITKTEGYSGADIANVCRDASMMPMRRKLHSGGFNIQAISDMESEIDIPLEMDDFVEALKNTSKSVS